MALHDVVGLGTKDRCEIIRLLRQVEVFTTEELGFFGRMFDQCRLGCGPCELQCCAVKRENGSLKGFVCFGATPLTEGTYDIYWLAVDPADQQEGVGTALVEHVCDEARAAGAGQVLIETSSVDAYEATRDAYARMGFVEVARVPDYYRPGVDRVILVRKLHADTAMGGDVQ